LDYCHDVKIFSQYSYASFFNFKFNFFTDLTQTAWRVCSSMTFTLSRVVTIKRSNYGTLLFAKSKSKNRQIMGHHCLLKLQILLHSWLRWNVADSSWEMHNWHWQKARNQKTHCMKRPLLTFGFLFEKKKHNRCIYSC